MSHLLFVDRSCSTAPISGAFVFLQKTYYNRSVPSGCLYECNKPRTDEWFFIIYFPGDCYKILWRLSNFYFNRKILTSREKYQREGNWKTEKKSTLRSCAIFTHHQTLYSLSVNTGFRLENMKESDRLEDLSEDGTIILKYILKKYLTRRGLDSSGL